ncbi:hypothetical protein IE81DRAFT_73759 [Ceraceosorus guamensis]|uniref:Uncharacterized protein n=1 Tax=Ceraceosorus guamensis TaxID=1522189 RepID=A0A316VP21_9BASI|nr:hypothetical protein IE81DRAFT_73759 [Ceraceosorus guamensis]PWN38818.1 hypothetical protein IE81DRAFT_73759 [Ceraceosorus guamensis]
MLPFSVALLGALLAISAFAAPHGQANMEQTMQGFVSDPAKRLDLRIRAPMTVVLDTPQTHGKHNGVWRGKGWAKQQQTIGANVSPDRDGGKVHAVDTTMSNHAPGAHDKQHGQTWAVIKQRSLPPKAEARIVQRANEGGAAQDARLFYTPHASPPVLRGRGWRMGKRSILTSAPSPARVEKRAHFEMISTETFDPRTSTNNGGPTKPKKRSISSSDASAKGSPLKLFKRLFGGLQQHYDKEAVLYAMTQPCESNNSIARTCRPVTEYKGKVLGFQDTLDAAQEVLNEQKAEAAAAKAAAEAKAKGKGKGKAKGAGPGPSKGGPGGIKRRDQPEMIDDVQILSSMKRRDDFARARPASSLEKKAHLETISDSAAAHDARSKRSELRLSRRSDEHDHDALPITKLLRRLTKPPGLDFDAIRYSILPPCSLFPYSTRQAVCRPELTDASRSPLGFKDTLSVAQQVLNQEKARARARAAAAAAKAKNKGGSKPSPAKRPVASPKRGPVAPHATPRTKRPAKPPARRPVTSPAA